MKTYICCKCKSGKFNLFKWAVKEAGMINSIYTIKTKGELLC